LSLIANEIDEPFNDDTLMTALLLAAGIFRRCDITPVCQDLPDMVVRLIILMNTHNPECLPDPSEWSSSRLAGRCVRELCHSAPAIVIPVLGEFAENNCQSGDPHLRETSLRCLRAVFGATRESSEDLFLAVVELAAGRLTDDFPAVRFVAADCLTVMFRQYPDASPAVAEVIPVLLELARDYQEIAIAAFAAVDAISKTAHFAQFPSLFEAVAGLIPELPPQIATSAFACFAIDQRKEIEPELALGAIAFLMSSADSAAFRDFDMAELTAVCDGFHALIPKAGPEISEGAPAILESLIQYSTNFAIGVAIEAAAELSIWAPELIRSVLPELIDVIEASSARVEDVDVVLGAIRALPILYRHHLDLAQFHERILNIFANCLQGVTGASTKSRVLCAFAALLTIESAPQTLVLGSLVPAICDLVRQLNYWGQLYQEDSQGLLSTMAGVFIQLLAMTSGGQRSELFDFALGFIREVHQSIVVAQYLKGALGELISRMFRLTEIEPGDLIAAFHATLMDIFPLEELQALLTDPAE
jgi:hypothetical protein